MTDPSTIVTVGFALVWTIGLILGTTYLRGGGEAVRRILPGLTILIAITAVFLFGESIVTPAVGSITVAIVLFPVILLLLVVQVLRVRRRGAGAPDGMSAAAAASAPALKRFVVVWMRVLVVGSILISFVAARAGY